MKVFIRATDLSVIINNGQKVSKRALSFQAQMETVRW